MSLRTCKFCQMTYEDTWSNWYGKFCCKTCYIIADPIYKKGDQVYTFRNEKEKDTGYLKALLDEGEVVYIHKLYRASKNGIYQYAIKSLTTNRISYRFFKDIFNNQLDCLSRVDVINKRREIMREAKRLFPYEEEV